MPWRKIGVRKPENGAEHSFVKVKNIAVLAEIDGNRLTARAGGVAVKLSGRESEELLTKVFLALKAIS